ncbi:hypothetical protein, partial [Acinetobacter baumannii]|uniref:hypothetical protein n=1 Tax=Acinetobacter baumannii TaxID=470 RepID=UPI001C09CD4E
MPHTKALWELVRIIFTEPPKTFSDAIRFEALKIAVVTGLRVGEWTRLPVDCLRWREYFDAGNNPAGDKGGISRSLMLRHFAEKQQEDRGASGMFLFENTQHVPPLFE